MIFSARFGYRFYTGALHAQIFLDFNGRYL